MLVAGLPLHTSPLPFVAQLRFDRSEVGEKQLTLRLYDPEDRVMAEIFVPLRVETPFPGEQSIARVAVALSNIVFRSEGVHHVQLDDPGGTQISRLPVRVKPAPSFP